MSEDDFDWEPGRCRDRGSDANNIFGEGWYAYRIGDRWKLSYDNGGVIGHTAIIDITEEEAAELRRNSGGHEAFDRIATPERDPGRPPEPWELPTYRCGLRGDPENGSAGLSDG